MWRLLKARTDYFDPASLLAGLASHSTLFDLFPPPTRPTNPAKIVCPRAGIEPTRRVLAHQDYPGDTARQRFQGSRTVPFLVSGRGKDKLTQIVWV